MEFKYQWNEEQKKIITAVKKQLARKGFYVAVSTIISVQMALEKYGVPFYEAWDHLDEDLNQGWHPFHEYVIVQGVCGVFVPERAITFKGRMKECNTIHEKLFAIPEKWDAPDRFPVRLSDKELQRSAEMGDLARIIILYDMAFTKGAKLKNIYHALLNNGHYDAAVELDKHYGGLDMVDQKMLFTHYICGNDTFGRKNFDLYYCRNLGVKNKNFWADMDESGSWELMENSLNGGIPADYPIFRDRGNSLSFRDYMHFLDESCDGVTDNKLLYSAFGKHLQVSRTFCEWEKRQKTE